MTSQFSFGALLDRPDFIFRIIESTDAVGIEVQGDAFFTQGGDPAGELDDLGVAKIPFCFGRMRYTGSKRYKKIQALSKPGPGTP